MSGDYGGVNSWRIGSLILRAGFYSECGLNIGYNLMVLCLDYQNCAATKPLWAY
jgi:hypothetical protein